MFRVTGKVQLSTIFFQPKLLSYELLDLVSSHFNLKEKEFFGLAFLNDKYVNHHLLCTCGCSWGPTCRFLIVLCCFAVVSASGCRWTAEFWTMTFQRRLFPLPSASWSGNSSSSYDNHRLPSRKCHLWVESILQLVIVSLVLMHLCPSHGTYQNTYWAKKKKPHCDKLQSASASHLLLSFTGFMSKT